MSKKYKQPVDSIDSVSAKNCKTAIDPKVSGLKVKSSDGSGMETDQAEN